MLAKTFLSITTTAVVPLGLLAGVSAPAHSTQVSDSASVLSAKKKPAAKKKAAAKKPAVKQVSKKAAKKAKKAAKKAKKKAAKKAAQCKTKKQKKTAKCKKAKKPAIPTAPRGNWTTVGATDLGVAPAANMILNPMGRPILTLHSYNGSIFYGMGNYDVNAGGAAGISVASYSPSSGWSTLLSGFATEEINTFRNYGGKLYTPNVDPSSGYTSGQVFASNASGAWSPSPSTGSISAEHVFDVAVVSHGIYVAGSSNSGAATLWRSLQTLGLTLLQPIGTDMSVTIGLASLETTSMSKRIGGPRVLRSLRYRNSMAPLGQTFPGVFAAVTWAAECGRPATFFRLTIKSGV